jgi:hypothetical protein
VVGWKRGVEKVVLEAGGSLGGHGLAAGRGGDDGDELKLGDGATRDVDALGVGADVRRGELEANVVDKIVEQRGVEGSEAFEVVGLFGVGAEGDAEPEAFAAGTREEGTASEALGRDGVRQVEVADVADVLDVPQNNRDNSPTEVEKIDRLIVDEAGYREVAGDRFSADAAHDDLFARGRHVSRIVA